MKQFSFILMSLAYLLIFAPPVSAQMQAQQQAQQQMLMQQQRVQQQQLEQQRLQQRQLQEQMLRQQQMLKQQQQEREKQQLSQLQRSIQSRQDSQSRQATAPAQKAPATSRLNVPPDRNQIRKTVLAEEGEISGKPVEGVFGMFGGWVLFVGDGKPKFACASLKQPRHKNRIASKETLTSGRHEIIFDFKYDGGDIGKSGIGLIFVDGKVVQGRIEQADRAECEGIETRTNFTILLDENRFRSSSE